MIKPPQNTIHFFIEKVFMIQNPCQRYNENTEDLQKKMYFSGDFHTENKNGQV